MNLSPSKDKSIVDESPNTSQSLAYMPDARLHLRCSKLLLNLVSMPGMVSHPPKDDQLALLAASKAMSHQPRPTL